MKVGRPDCIPRRYWAFQSLGSIASGATAVATAWDFNAYTRRHPDVEWWRMVAITYTRNTAATGNLRFYQFLADGLDLGADVVVGGGQFGFDLNVLLPQRWSGNLAHMIDNWTGAVSVFGMSIGIEPLFDTSMPVRVGR